MTLDDRIAKFLAGKRFAVAGASRERAKYGNKVLRVYQQHGLEVFPVNPQADQIEGLTAYADLKSLPGPIDGVSIVTPPDVTEKIVEQAIELGIQNIWMQPGAESTASVADAERSGANLIAGGPCILVALGYRENDQ